jgi:hypothetical protein
MPCAYYMKRCGSFQMFDTSGPPTPAMRKNLAMAPTDDKDDAAKERDVMSALPRTRPQRRSARRPPAVTAGASPDGAKAAAAKPASAERAAGGRAKPRTGAAKPRTAAAKPRTAAAKPRTTAAATGRGKPRTTAAATARAKPRTAAAKPRTAAAKPRAAAQAKAAAAPKAPAAAAPTARTRRGRQAEEIPAAGYATDGGQGRPGTGELVTTAFQAVGELAQIGVTVGGQALRSALSRLPRP